MKYKIYRLCRSQEKIEELKREEDLYSLPKTKYVTGIDMYQFINDIIENSQEDYALLCHDDVVLPLTINENIEKCIKSANDFLGEENWGIIGNAGIQIFTKKVLLYLTDPNIKLLPPKTEVPELVESIDGNTMLLNLRNIREKKVALPSHLSGFHLYDLILCLEAQKKGLLCAVSSYLFVSHLSGGNRQAFIDSWHTEMFQKYFSKTFSNKVISSLNGEITISQPHRENIKIEKMIEENIIRVFSEKKYELNIISQKETKAIKQLKEERVDNILLKIHTGTEIAELIKEIENDESFTIILQERDTILPDIFRYLPYFFSKSKIIIGDTKMTNEQGGEIAKAIDIEDIYTGKRDKPLNIVIYKTSLLKTVVKETNIKGFHEFNIFVNAIKYSTYDTYPILFGERDYNKEDYSISQYPFTTALADAVNTGVLNKNIYNFHRNNIEQLEERISRMGSEYNKFMTFKNGRLWRLLLPFRKFYSFIKKK